MNLVNWFPGHMAKAMKEIKAIQSLVDCFIVVLDARVPLSSYNDEFDQIAPHKPRLFIFTKVDLIDQNQLKPILAKFNNENDRCVLVNLKNPKSRQKVLSALNQILANKKAKDLQRGLVKPRLRCLVLGMPNVGKSTLINLLAKSKKTQVANFAGTTRSTQWINADAIQLMDTPGILMPKIEDPQVALKLLACNLIKQNVINDQEFYFQILDLLNQVSPEKIQELGIQYFETENQKFDQLIIYGRKHQLFLKKNEIDLKKVLSQIRTKLLNLKNIIWDK